MKHEQMQRIVVTVPTWAYDELLRNANEREWSISHLVRFLVCGTLDAWERQAYETEKDHE